MKKVIRVVAGPGHRDKLHGRGNGTKSDDLLVPVKYLQATYKIYSIIWQCVLITEIYSVSIKSLTKSPHV